MCSALSSLNTDNTALGSSWPMTQVSSLREPCTLKSSKAKIRILLLSPLPPMSGLMMGKATILATALILVWRGGKLWKCAKITDHNMSTTKSSWKCLHQWQQIWRWQMQQIPEMVPCKWWRKLAYPSQRTNSQQRWSSRTCIQSHQKGIRHKGWRWLPL